MKLTNILSLSKIRRPSPLAALSIAGLCLGISGCSGDFEVSGSAPVERDVMVVWIVSSGSPDYLYKFGEGSADGERFEVSLSDDPPAEAINSYGVGVGLVVALPDGVSMPPDGIIDDDLQDKIFDASTLISDRHAVVFKQDGGEGLDWTGDFDEGFSCGRCVEAAEGFDSYEPTSCEDLELRTEASGDVCNWT